MADEAQPHYTPTGLPVQQQYFRLRHLKQRYGVSGSSIWAWVKKGTFPKPLKLAANTTCWRLADLLAWEATRAASSKLLPGRCCHERT